MILFIINILSRKNLDIGANFMMLQNKLTALSLQEIKESRKNINIYYNADRRQLMINFFFVSILTSHSFLIDIPKFIYMMQYGGIKLKIPIKPRTQPRNLGQPHAFIVKNNHPQNADLPRYYSKKEKKPFPIPIVELRRNARARMKGRKKGEHRTPVPPPKIGLLVKSLIPVAYDVFNARITLINNLKKLLRVVPVHACR